MKNSARARRGVHRTNALAMKGRSQRHAKGTQVYGNEFLSASAFRLCFPKNQGRLARLPVIHASDLV